jgi:hypothetical protein
LPYFVNKYGNGPDVWQQKWFAGALLRGWTATKGDAATHFVVIDQENNGGTFMGGTFRLEAVNGSGVATGLCIANTEGGWGHGTDLTLTPCNRAKYQVLTYNASNGEVLSSAGVGEVPGSGGHLEPNGTGGVLSFQAAADNWGGYHYTWKDLASLPG